jgi:hypothetical protein
MRSKRGHGTLRLLLLVAAIGTTALLATATGAAAGSVGFVSGSQTLVNEGAGLYAMQGSLVGKWQMTSFATRSESTRNNVYTIVGTGTETFDGCLDADRSGSCEAGEPTGTIDFAFVFRGTYDATTGAQLSGACIHPVVGGTSDFSRTRGVLAFRDDVNTGISYYTGFLART